MSLIRHGLHTSKISPMQENLTSFTSLSILHAAFSTSPGRTHPSCGHSAKKAMCFEYKPAFRENFISIMAFKCECASQRSEILARDHSTLAVP